MGIHAAYCSYDEGGECSCGTEAATIKRLKLEARVNQRIRESQEAEQKKAEERARPRTQFALHNPSATTEHIEQCRED